MPKPQSRPVHAPGPLFHGVCHHCLEMAKFGRVLEAGPKTDLDLPPYAAQAIEALTQCRGLTRREREVLTLCCRGAKNSVIAELLGISVPAVRRHLRNLHKKTNTSDKSDLILNLWHCCPIPREKVRIP